MRFAELQLIAYGHFTDRRLVFAHDSGDLQLVFGANEAGKSTARSAIGDFLFGFPTQTPLNFVHAYNALRIGARIETDTGQVLAVIRKKGRKNTLLDENGDPATGLEAGLERQLAGADRAFFSRMFSLDHEGLRAGGQALAAARAGADTALLSAGSGLADVLAEREALVREADGLWSPNASQNRRYYQAEARLKAADQAIHEHEVTVSEWRRLRSAYDTAEAHYRELAARRSHASHQWRELERIRRVAQPVRRYREIEAELEALGETAPLDSDARTVYETARETIETADTASEAIHEQIARIDAELATLVDDPALRDAGEAIERLAEQRPRIADDRERLAEIEQSRAQLVEALTRDRAELGWREATTDWPTTAALARARQLAGEAATRGQSVEHAAGNRDAACQTEARLAAEAESIGEARDTAALEAWLAATTREGDLEAELRAGQGRAEQTARRLERLLTALDPSVADSDTLAALDVPSRDAISNFEREMAEADDAQRHGGQRVDDLSDEAARARDALARRRADEALPGADDLIAARRQRDACWQLVRRRYVEKGERDLFDDPDLEALDESARNNPADALDAAMSRADAFADARFERHEAIARDAERQRQVAEREQALEQAVARRDEAHTRLEGLRTEWAALWQPAGITPAGPAAMRDWLEQRREALEARGDRIEAETERDTLARRITEHRSRIAPYLGALGVADDEIAEASLAVLVERARRLVEREQRRAAEQQRLARERREQAARISALEAEHDKARAAHRDWQQAWASALAALGLANDLDAGAATAALDVLEAARKRVDRVHELDAEHDDLMARRERFESDLERVLAATEQSHSDDALPEARVQRLAVALRDARSQHQQRTTREADRAAQAEQLAEHERQRAGAEDRLAALLRRADVADRDALETAIADAERRRALADEHATTVAVLGDQGDGVPIEDLVAAVEASDLDSLREQIERLQIEIDDLDGELGTARDARNAARAAFQAIGGDDRAAVAATERQTALADMTDAAEQYLRVGSAAILLKWAGQRYAMDRHGPLIARGSTLMNHLTGGSIERLTGEFDEADELQIVGVRPDGSRVAPTGMSEGTRDQLYLALRVAAIEDYLGRAAPLPVVADDLFINFDDERALAGLDILAGLAEKTQVLFFTHHQHLRDMATEALGKRVTTHDL